MTTDLSHIDTIIFDLGGVLLNLSYQRTAQAFAALSGRADAQQLYTQAMQEPIFDQYEMGLIGDEAFRDGLRALLQTQADDQALDQAWNAMLLDLPAERIRFVDSLRASKRVLLLSNTNAIHIRAFEQIFAQTMQGEYAHIGQAFDQVYYSYQMADRKPHPSIFLSVCQEHGIDPARTLFIDDSEQHVLGARKAGLQAVHLTGGKTIFDLGLQQLL